MFDLPSELYEIKYYVSACIPWGWYLRTNWGLVQFIKDLWSGRGEFYYEEWKKTTLQYWYLRLISFPHGMPHIITRDGVSFIFSAIDKDAFIRENKALIDKFFEDSKKKKQEEDEKEIEKQVEELIQKLEKLISSMWVAMEEMSADTRTRLWTVIYTRLCKKIETELWSRKAILSAVMKPLSSLVRKLAP